MRIVAGRMKGRQIKAVPGVATRPTSDKVKEAVFQIMGPFFDGGTCLDLFAGSGSLGIEAISRGMDKAIFIDKNRQAIHTINKNTNALNISNHVEIYRNDASRALQAIAKRNLTFDLILIDPPYEKFSYNDLLQEVIALNILSENGIVYCEHSASNKLTPINNMLTIKRQAIYGGSIGVTIFERV
ncbi:16S rRNA (guanine(966)-N(2))-methyltransferase RsmD [Virgibacillus sp. W0430]|uniref:16S rRNA (guanine(966)-N(2))-methyltransferase RsmD n=1 Tax=Virgibacillus sp. W0430 TaxID=3391580 RepID=UPI003F44BAA1